MGILDTFLRYFGLSGDARVRVRAPKIEVQIVGDPTRVRWMLEAVRRELERNPGYRGQFVPRARRTGKGEDLVQPTELDEQDSPYALPGAPVGPVRGQKVSSGDPARIAPRGVDIAPAMSAGPQSVDGALPTDGSQRTNGSQHTDGSQRTDGARHVEGPEQRSVPSRIVQVGRPTFEITEDTGRDHVAEDDSPISEEETPSDFEAAFGSEETVDNSSPLLPKILPGRFTPDVRPTDEVRAAAARPERRPPSRPRPGSGSGSDSKTPSTGR